MDEKDKDLLLKDLSARVFYGVKVNIERDFPNNPPIVERIAKDGEIIVNGILAYDIYYYKPYLRPMSSMTEEERLELSRLTDDKFKFYLYTLEPEIICYEKYNYLEGLKVLDWLLAHHFDYRGLIPRGLALEAPEGMYKN